MSDDLRYKAFLSYSHRDSRAAGWLHRRLEAYRLPKALRIATHEQRLRPVFRDRDELASSAALSGSIQAALDASEALLVLCSPAAVASRWVNEEIGYFRRTHPQRKVLAFIIDGDPGADPLGDGSRACFPPNLLLVDAGNPAGERLEPAAPDARKDGDGREAAFLKLVAGLLDLPYDKLRQRELRRQQQRWTLLGAGSFVLAAIFAVLAWQAMIARDAAQLAQARAELEADTARQTSEFMISLFQVSEPGEARGNSITAREVLDRGVERIETARIDKPLVKSRLLGTMGQVYTGLGLYPRAQELLGLAEQLLTAASSSTEEQAQRFDVQWELADLLYAKGDYGTAMQVVARIEAPQREDHESQRRRARLANLRADLAWQDGDDQAARQHYQSALANLGELAQADPVQSARALGGLGRIALLGNRPQDAMPLLDQAYHMLQGHFGPDHPDTLVVLNLHASAAYRNADNDKARSLWSEALAAGRRIYGEQHPEVATYLSNLALLDLEACRFDTAEAMFREAVAIDRRARSEGVDELAYTLNSLALARIAAGDLAEAESLLGEARAIAVDHRHPMLGPVSANLADLLCASDRQLEGQTLAQESIMINREEYGEQHWRTRQAELVTAWCGAPAAAALDASAALDSISARWGDANLYAQRALAQLRDIRVRNGDAAGAAALAARIGGSACAGFATESGS
jgi:tetratricopeptide (TPR) repeat protein